MIGGAVRGPARGATLSRAETVEVWALVREALPDAVYRVELDDGHQILARLGREMSRGFHRIQPGDRVRVELSTSDSSRGRIVDKRR